MTTQETLWNEYGDLCEQGAEVWRDHDANVCEGEEADCQAARTRIAARMAELELLLTS